MTRQRWSAALVSVVLAALAACQPLPHPFADDRPPAALLQVPGSIDIAVGNFDGEPQATAAKLSAATASQFLKHDITASATAASHSGYALDGHIEQGPVQSGKTTVTVLWRLHDPSGRLVTEHRTSVSGPVGDWRQGADALVEQLAADGVDVIASLVTEATPKEQQQASGKIRVAVRKVAGAPGDGNDALTTSMTAVLSHADIVLVDPAKGNPDLDVDCNVSVERNGNAQHVKIVWRVSHASGAEIGTVAQENDVSRGRLDGAWGDIAYTVAIAAGDGVIQLLSRGVSPIKLGAAAPAPAAPPAPPSPATPVSTQALPPASPGSAPVPGNIASPAVNLPPVNVGPDPAEAPPKHGKPPPQ